MPVQSREQFIGNLHRRVGHCGRITEHQFLKVRESGRGFKIGQCHQLLFGDACSSAHGRSDIDSERATDSVAALISANTLSFVSKVFKACWPISMPPTASNSRG